SRDVKVINELKNCNLNSQNPSIKQNPENHTKNATMNNDIPVSNACTTYSAGAKNINENSRGSVTPVRNEAKPAASIRDFVVFLRLGLAVWYIAKAAAGKPNIIIG